MTEPPYFPQELSYGTSTYVLASGPNYDGKGVYYLKGTLPAADRGNLWRALYDERKKKFFYVNLKDRSKKMWSLPEEEPSAASPTESSGNLPLAAGKAAAPSEGEREQPSQAGTPTSKKGQQKRTLSPAQKRLELMKRMEKKFSSDGANAAAAAATVEEKPKKSKKSKHASADQATTEQRKEAEEDAEVIAQAQPCGEETKEQELESDELRRREQDELRSQEERQAEAQRQAEARRQAELETEARKQAEARRQEERQAEARRQAEVKREEERQAEARRQAELETEAQRQAEARRQAELETEARKQAEARRQEERQAEARRQAEVKREEERQAEARTQGEAQREAEAERESGRRAADIPERRVHETESVRQQKDVVVRGAPMPRQQYHHAPREDKTMNNNAAQFQLAEAERIRREKEEKKRLAAIEAERAERKAEAERSFQERERQRLAGVELDCVIQEQDKKRLDADIALQQHLVQEEKNRREAAERRVAAVEAERMLQEKERIRLEAEAERHQQLAEAEKHRQEEEKKKIAALELEGQLAEAKRERLEAQRKEEEEEKERFEAAELARKREEIELEQRKKEERKKRLALIDEERKRIEIEKQRLASLETERRRQLAAEAERSPQEKKSEEEQEPKPSSLHQKPVGRVSPMQEISPRSMRVADIFRGIRAIERKEEEERSTLERQQVGVFAHLLGEAHRHRIDVVFSTPREKIGELRECGNAGNNDGGGGGRATPTFRLIQEQKEIICDQEAVKRSHIFMEEVRTWTRLTDLAEAARCRTQEIVRERTQAIARAARETLSRDMRVAAERRRAEEEHYLQEKIQESRFESLIVTLENEETDLRQSLHLLEIRAFRKIVDANATMNLLINNENLRINTPAKQKSKFQNKSAEKKNPPHPSHTTGEPVKELSNGNNTRGKQQQEEEEEKGGWSGNVEQLVEQYSTVLKVAHQELTFELCRTYQEYIRSRLWHCSSERLDGQDKDRHVTFSPDDNSIAARVQRWKLGLTGSPKRTSSSRDDQKKKSNYGSATVGTYPGFSVPLPASVSPSLLNSEGTALEVYRRRCQFAVGPLITPFYFEDLASRGATSLSPFKKSPIGDVQKPTEVEKFLFEKYSESPFPPPSSLGAAPISSSGLANTSNIHFNTTNNNNNNNSEHKDLLIRVDLSTSPGTATQGAHVSHGCSSGQMDENRHQHVVQRDIFVERYEPAEEGNDARGLQECSYLQWDSCENAIVDSTGCTAVSSRVSSELQRSQGRMETVEDNKSSSYVSFNPFDFTSFVTGSIGTSRGIFRWGVRVHFHRDKSTSFLPSAAMVSSSQGRQDDEDVPQASKKEPARVLMIGVAPRYFRGKRSDCPAYFYRSDGCISCRPDGSHEQEFGDPIYNGSYVVVHLDLTHWELSFYVDGVSQGVAFRFTPIAEPEPLFPVVVFSGEGDAVSLSMT